MTLQKVALCLEPATMLNANISIEPQITKVSTKPETCVIYVLYLYSGPEIVDPDAGIC